MTQKTFWTLRRKSVFSWISKRAFFSPAFDSVTHCNLFRRTHFIMISADRGSLGSLGSLLPAFVPASPVNLE
jgi:hypothetical protein